MIMDLGCFFAGVVTYGVEQATQSDGMPLEGPGLACSAPRDIHCVVGQWSSDEI